MYVPFKFHCAAWGPLVVTGAMFSPHCVALTSVNQRLDIYREVNRKPIRSR